MMTHIDSPPWYDRDHGANLFTDDGSVKLPRLAGLAMSMAVKSDGNLSRQSTPERAQKVMDALGPLATERGVTLSIVHVRSRRYSRREWWCVRAAR